MSVGTSTNLKRLGCAMGCAVVFVCLGLFVVNQWLPRDRVLVQHFHFDAPSTARVDWDSFFEGEEETIKYLVRQNRIDWPCSTRSVLKKLSFRRSDSPAILTLRLRSSIHQDFHQPFLALIDCYVNNQGQKKKDTSEFVPESLDVRLSRSSDEHESRSFRSILLDQLKRQYDRKETQTQEMEVLQLKHNRLGIETVAMEQSLGDTSGNPSAGFEEYLKPFSRNILEADGYLHQLQQLLLETRKQRDRLDIRMGQVSSSRELVDLEDELTKTHGQCLSLEDELAQRQRVTLQRMRVRLWPEYRKELKIQVRHQHQLLVELGSRKLIAIESLKWIEKNISKIHHDLALAERTSASTSQTAWGPQTNFSPRLFRPITSLSLVEEFGQWQWAGLFVFALFGGLIGVVASGMIKPLPAERKVTQTKEGWLEENPEPLEPVVVHPPQTHPITQGSAEVPKKKKGSQKKARQKLKIHLDETVEPESLLVEPEMVETVDEKVADVPQANVFHTDAEPGSMDQCVAYAETIGTLQASTTCPFILVSALNAADASPRFVADLAIVLQRRRQRVLLIEADEASSVLAEKVFEFQTTPGFYEWRRGDAWVSQVSCETHLRDITFMPSGTASEDQCDAELNLSREEHRWSNLRTKFDVVLLYCPSALGQKPKPGHWLAAKHLLELTDGAFVLTQSRNLAKNEAKVLAILEDKKVELLNLVSIKK